MKKQNFAGAGSKKNNTNAWFPIAPFLLIAVALSPFLLQSALDVSQLFRAQVKIPDASDPARKNVPGEYRPEEYRLLLLMSLDLLVRAERVLKQELGSYTRAQGRVPDVLGAATLSYRVEIAKANSEQFLVTAAGQGFRSAFDTRSIAGDRLSINESFDVKSNFPLPPPPRDYLLVLAKGVLAKLERTDAASAAAETVQWLEGAYHGYFRYERRPRSTQEGALAWVAVGQSAPVEGEVIALDALEIANPPNLYRWVYEYRHSRWPEQEARAEMEKLFLAEKIHQARTGAFSYDLSELAASWNSLVGLRSEISPIELRGLAADPALGYRAEIAERVFCANDACRVPKEAAAARSWVLDSYGQISGSARQKAQEDVRDLMKQFDSAQRQIANTGADAPAILITDPVTGKPLLIDAMDSGVDFGDGPKNFDMSK